MEEYKKAFEIVNKMLSRYPRTVFEVRKKLKEKGFKENIIKEAINRFSEQGLLSDRNYAIMWLENQLKYRPTSRILCKKKMINRGLSNNLVDEILEEEYPLEKEINIAYGLARKKMIEIKDKPKTKKAKISKIGQYLDRKGFTEGVIWSVLEQLNLS